MNRKEVKKIRNYLIIFLALLGVFLLFFWLKKNKKENEEGISNDDEEKRKNRIQELKQERKTHELSYDINVGEEKKLAEKAEKAFKRIRILSAVVFTLLLVLVYFSGYWGWFDMMSTITGVLMIILTIAGISSQYILTKLKQSIIEGTKKRIQKRIYRYKPKGHYQKNADYAKSRIEKIDSELKELGDDA